MDIKPNYEFSLNKQKKHYCKPCKFISHNKTDFDRHMISERHIKKAANFVDNQDNYYGFIADCGKKYSYKQSMYRHMQTCEKCISIALTEGISNDKDINLKENEDIKNCQKITDVSNQIICSNCNKKYATRSGLRKHMLKCSNVPSQDTNIINETKPTDSLDNSIVNSEPNPQGSNKLLEFMGGILKKQQETNDKLLDQNEKLMELAKEGKTITNINNNKFSLNLFLNNQCKDAMNLMEFVDKIQCQLEDLEHTGRNGYVEGVSKLFIQGLRDIDITQRPIHCTDTKRDSIYIKHDDEWTKEDCNSSKMKRAIRHIADKNVKKIPEWQKNNPGYNKFHTATHEKYMGICDRVMGGGSEEETERQYRKIMKKITSEVVLDKESTNLLTMNSTHVD